MRYLFGAALIAVIFGIGFMLGKVGGGFDAAYKVSCAVVDTAVAKGELKEERLSAVIRDALASQQMGEKEIAAIGDFAKRQNTGTPCGRAIAALAGN